MGLGWASLLNSWSPLILSPVGSRDWNGRSLFPWSSGRSGRILVDAETHSPLPMATKTTSPWKFPWGAASAMVGVSLLTKASPQSALDPYFPDGV